MDQHKNLRDKKETEKLVWKSSQVKKENKESCTCDQLHQMNKS